VAPVHVARPRDERKVRLWGATAFGFLGVHPLAVMCGFACGMARKERNAANRGPFCAEPGFGWRASNEIPCSLSASEGGESCNLHVLKAVELKRGPQARRTVNPNHGLACA